MLTNLLSTNEISDILNDPIVKSNKEKLSTLQKVDFSIQLSDAIKNKLETGFNINLTDITSIPMRWIKGDTPEHADKGPDRFSNTYLMYLTDSIGNLIVDGQSYPIVAGDAHIFSEGLEHSTINTGTSERLMIGPMSETGFHVGAAVDLIYFNNETDAIAIQSSIGYSVGYTITTIDNISSWNISSNYGGTNPSPNGGPYNDGTTLIATGIYYLYPYVAPQQQTRPIYMSSSFTNNAQVYYKPHSLSTGGGGSGVRNSRHKQRKT
jgi:hypothetical protein